MNPITKADVDNAMINLALSVPAFIVPYPDIDIEEEHIPFLNIKNICHITSLQ